MKRNLILATFCLFALGSFAQTLPYKNPQLTAEQRADDLLQRLTLD